jgi:DNA-binding NarL/FixJ family response regulator
MPSGRDLRAEQRNKILRLALAGVSPKAIAERMGLSESTVRKHYPLPGKHKHDELRADLE